MGNAQTSICFRASWKTGEDRSEQNYIRKLWPIVVKDIDLNDHMLGDFMDGKKCAVIVNVASQ